ncbi:sensor histidine kinase, partial [candidate division KSB1 bacterium]
IRELITLHLEQVFINLIENSLNYTERGTILITAEKEPEYVVIRVTDTGIGIEPEHQSRIFERFFVVNKARSRTLGGTGLGLSIVKHIVLLHNGKIDVESALDSGTSFIIRFPAAQSLNG